MADKQATHKAQRTMEGEVVSSTQNKTIVVKVTRTFRHPLLGKTIRRSKTYQAHDEQNSARIGDFVEVMESRPYSKTKHMVLHRIVRSAA